MTAPGFHPAPWGRLLIGVTIGGGVLCFAVGGLVLWLGGGPWWAAAVAPILFAGSAPFAVLGYEVDAGCLVVRRPGWGVRLPLDRLTDARREPRAMRGSLRLCGNGGLWVFAGWYWNKRLGRYRAFVTDLDRTVVLRFAERTVVVSPGDPELFVLEVGRASAAGRVSRAEP